MHGLLSSALRLAVEMPLHLFGAEGVDEGFGVNFTDFLDNPRPVGSGYHGVDNDAFRSRMALAPKDRGPVMCVMINQFRDFMRMVGHDKEGLLLIAVIERMDDLRRDELINDGIESAVPAEEDAGSNQNDGVDAEADIPGVHAVARGEPGGDKVGSSAGGVCGKTDRNAESVDQPAENTDQKRVIGNDEIRESIDKAPL